VVDAGRNRIYGFNALAAPPKLIVLDANNHSHKQVRCAAVVCGQGPQ